MYVPSAHVFIVGDPNNTDSHSFADTLEVQGNAGYSLVYTE